jgi:hypothetical protein
MIGRRNDHENKESREVEKADHYDDINHTNRRARVQPVRVTWMCGGALRAGKAEKSRCLFQTRKRLVIEVVGRRTSFAPQHETGTAESLTRLHVDRFVVVDTSSLRSRRLR